MMLLDTSGLLCCFDADESRHSDAVQFFEAAPLRLTHNYVLAEFVALAQARGLPREASLSFAGELAIDASVELVWVSQPMHEEAMRLLQAQLDKAYSLCDAISFLVMRRRGILAALDNGPAF
jgi:uncharacterized protein